MEIEKCNSIKFGEDYQLLLERHQINNSYCIKNFEPNFIFLINAFIVLI